MVKDSAKLIAPLDERIENLVKAKESIESKKTQIEFDPISKEDIAKLTFADDLAKIKEVQREKILEDLSLLLNEKVKELERKETENEEKELILNDLTNALNEKISQLKTSNLQLQKEKQYSTNLNGQLKNALKKVSESEMELKIERDWLAEQVEKKSLEVLRTIEQLMRAEKGKN